MYSFSKYKDQYKSNLRLALPVVLTQLGQILTQVADNLMVGRYGGDDPVPLAAVSFGGAVFFILFIAAIGIALGMTPLVGELYAQGDREKSAGLLQNGILFYTLLGFAMAAVQYAVIPLMYDLGQPVEVVDMAIPYYKMLVFSMPFVMLFFAFKQFLEGVGNTKVEMVVTIIANMANIGFNAVFIYGRFGLPEMGAEGAGLGTLLSRIIAPILMIGYFYNRHKYRGYLDLNGDGYVNNGNNTIYDHGDLVKIGNTTPRYSYSIQGGVRWNGIGISMMWQGVGKRDWYPAKESGYFWGQYGRPYSMALPWHNSDRWSPTNRGAYWPRLVGYSASDSGLILAQPNTRYVQDASYIRLKNLTIDYNFPKELVNKIGLQALKIYVSGENLLTFSPLKKYAKNYDPEGIYAGDADYGTNKFGSDNFGDGDGYPVMKSYTIGLSITF